MSVSRYYPHMLREMPYFGNIDDVDLYDMHLVIRLEESKISCCQSNARCKIRQFSSSSSILSCKQEKNEPSFGSQIPANGG
jgi:hypothetical protein